MVVGLIVLFVLFYISQALIITHVARFLDCSGFIVYLCIVFWDIAHAVFLQLLAWWCWGSMNHSCIVSFYPHQTAQAQLQLWSLATLNAPLLTCRRQCQTRPHSVAPNFHAERSLSQTPGDLNVSNYSILNRFRLHRIWLFEERPDSFNPLGVGNSMLTKFRQKLRRVSLPQTSWKHHILGVPTTATSAAVDGNIPWCRRSAERSHYWAMGTWCSGMLWDEANKQIPTTRLRRMKSSNISSLRSWTSVWEHTRPTCWRKETPLCISQALRTGMVSRSWWLACRMISLSGSENCTLPRIWDGMTISNGLLHTGVETSPKAWDGWCGSHPTLSTKFTPLSIALTVIRHQNASILKCTLRTGGGRHR